VARFLADHNVPGALSALVSNQGHDVLLAYPAGLAQVNDAVLLWEAARDNRILITLNGKDLLLLHRAWLFWPGVWKLNYGPMHRGILTLPSLPHAEYPLVTQAIDQLVSTRASLVNELHAWVNAQWVQRQ
jgi:hypothetical protein